MLTKTALLALIPTGVALLAGAALPFQAASDAAGNAATGGDPGHPLWGTLAAVATTLIIVTAAASLLRFVRGAAKPHAQEGSGTTGSDRSA